MKYWTNIIALALLCALYLLQNWQQTRLSVYITHPAHHSAPASAAVAEGSRSDCIQICSPHVQVSSRVCTCIPYRRALSGGRWCRGSSATSFQFIFVTDCQPHPTVYRRWPSFSSRHCSHLEQSAWSCHFHTFHGCLAVPAQKPPVQHFLPFPLVIAQCLRSDA